MLRPVRLRVSVVALLLAAEALANIGAAQPDAAVGGSLRTTATAMQVEAEQLSFDCEEEHGRPRCAFTARYQLLNPTAEAQVAVVAFYGVHSSAVQLTLDGRVVSRALTAEEVAALDLRVRPGSRSNQQLSHDGAELRLAGGQRAELVASGQLAPGRYFVPSYARSAVEVRHPLLGSEVPRSNTFNLDYLVAPIRSWAGPAPKISASLRAPPGWKVTLTAVTGDDSQVVELREGQATLDAASVDVLAMAIELAPQRVFNGGYLLGLGGTVGSGFRMRMGYEFAAPAWLFISLCAETDFEHVLTIVPLVHAASDALLGVIPSLSLGVGVPVQALPSPQVGVRVQATVHWPWVGFVAALDVFPGQAQVVQWTLLGQLGL